MASITATTTDPWRPRLPPEQRVRGLLAVGGLALLEVLIGVGVASSHYKYAILLVAAVPIFWLVWRFPTAGIVVMLFFAAGIITPTFFTFRFAGRTVFAYEVLLVILLLRAAIRPNRATWGGAAGAFLLGFLAVLALSTVLAINSGDTAINNALTYSRAFYALSVFWVVIRLAPDRRRLGMILIGAFVLAALSGVVGLALALSGNLHTIFQGSGDQLQVPSSIGSLLRVRMPGLGLGFMLLWLGIVWLIRGRRPRWVWAVCLPWILVDILISQNRNMWVIGTLSLILVMFVTGPLVRGRLIACLVALCAVLAILVVAPLGGSGTASPLAPIAARASTILNPKAVQSSNSATDRDYEITEGWKTAKRHLAIGIGPGVFYGATIQVGSGNAIGITARLFLQNQYLYILVTTGIPGIAMWILFLLATLRNAAVPGGPIESRLLGIGVLGLSLTAIVMLSFTDPSFLIALGLIAGVIYALKPQLAGERRGISLAAIPEAG